MAGKKQAGRPKPWPVNVYGVDEEGGRQRTRLFFATREEAEQRAAELRRAVRAFTGRRAFDLEAFEDFLAQRPAEAVRGGARWAEWAEVYFEDMAARGLSREHCSHSRTQVGRLVEQLERGAVAATPASLQEALHRIPGRPGTRRAYRATWSGFFAWLERTGRQEQNPMRQVRAPKIVQAEPEALEVAAVEGLLRRAWEEDRALVPYLAVQAFAGLRVATAQRLDGRELVVPERSSCSCAKARPGGTSSGWRWTWSASRPSWRP